ncbi:RING-like-containing protein [Coleophoma cylindrospora]|uniref:Non-structural maintenance of chromosomes element 1 homolog n=1 Tax=Coleophoma cylindrospora TaxID=1849047 RepID=A0A3D8RT98_9HELO|nr:RING-like-containing protein [Coleophoma cylindrospora]
MDVDDDPPQRYNDTNRAFLQAFIARGSLTFKEAQPILAGIFTASGDRTSAEEVTQDDFDSYVAAAANALSPFDMEIRSMAHQVTRTRVWAIVNSTSDLITQGATTRTREELAYIKRLIDAMFDTFNTPRREIMGITSMQALNSSVRKGGRQSLGGDESQATQSADKGMTSSQAEKILNDMVVEGWFERSREGWYTLSAQALMELRGWLVEAYNDSEDPDEWQRIKMCMGCSDIITIGQRCPNMDCNARLHDICEATYWQGHKTREGNKCPKCGTEWTGKNYVGEKAETTRESYQIGKRKSGAKRRQEQVADEEEQSEGDDPDAEGEDE